MQRIAPLLLFCSLSIVVACGDAELSSSNSACPECDEGGGEVEVPDDLLRPARERRPTMEVPDLQIPSAEVAEFNHYSSLETVVPEEPVRAGTPVHVTCLGLNPYNIWEVVEGFETRLQTWPESSFTDAEDPGMVVPIKAGTALVACAVPGLGLLDDTPAELTISPGDPHATIATASRPQIPAGEVVNVECLVLDAYENVIEDAEPEIKTDPDEGGVFVEGTTITFERTGVYMITCDLPGVEKAWADQVEVVPGLPAMLSISPSPLQDVYGIGQVITIEVHVTDMFGNTVYSADIDLTSDPAGEDFGERRYVYHEDGLYTVTATVLGDTHDGVELTDSVLIEVNGFGPGLFCDIPPDAGWVDAAPGDFVDFSGSFSDANGVVAANLDGIPLTVDDEGAFTQSIAVDYGINFVDLEGEDTHGEVNSATCSFLASDEWAPPTEFIDDTVVLRLNQAAVDDGNRRDGLDSLNDLLYTVLNSSGLRTEVDRALHGANPLKPNSCDLEVDLLFFSFCAFRSEIRYEDLRLSGPHDTSLQLVNGGMRAAATLRGLGIKINADATISARGWINLSHLTVDMTMNMSLTDGRPRVTIRSVNRVDVGSIDLDFGGILGLIIDLIEGLFHGIIRNLVRDTIRDFITDSFDDTLDGVIGGLDISTLGSRFDVPRLDGAGTIPVDFGVTFSSLDAKASYLQFGIGTRFAVPALRADHLPGVPLLPGPQVHDPATSQSVGVSIYIGLLNQVIYNLWRGGLFQAEMGTALLGDSVPEGTEAVIRAELPPVVQPMGENNLAITLGAFHVSLVYPGLFSEPLSIVVGARAETSFTLDGNSLEFGAIEITDMVFSTPTASLDRETRNVLEGFLTRVIQDIIDSSLSTALPALPIPGFPIPADLGIYGLPTGRELGLVEPGLNTNGNHFVLESDFGLR